MAISYEELDQYVLDVIDDLAVQEKLRQSFPDYPQEGVLYGQTVKYMPFDYHIQSWKEFVEYNEGSQAYENIIAVNYKKPCFLKGKNIVKLIQVALFWGDYIECYEELLNKQTSFSDNKKMILNEEEFEQYLLDVIGELAEQEELRQSFSADNKDLVEWILFLKALIKHKEGVSAYKMIIDLLSKYPCKLNGKNVVQLIQVALSLGNDIDYEHLLNK